jgi:outer membrane protein OmpA-like peptidoglycan-associated protein
MDTVAPCQLTGINRTQARRRPALAAAAVAAVILPGALLLAGCSQAQGSPKTFVIMASATANEPAPVLSSPERAVLRRAGGTSTDATAYVVNPDTGQARTVSLTPRRSNGDVDYGPDRDSRLTANVNRVQQLLSTLADSKPFDLLTMIAQAVRVTAHPGTLLILSSGLSTAGGLDLRQVGWGANPRAVAASLRRRGLLPRLAGWSAVFSGLGVTTGRQPAPPLPQRTILTHYWLALCRAAGAASCAVDTITRADPLSRSTTPVPVVRFPKVTSFRGPHGRHTTTIPADAFFAFGKARLLPGANSILRPIAERVRDLHLRVTIRGYASPDGGSRGYNLGLSARRARAVRAGLIRLGVPASQITGTVGLGTAGQPRSACYRHGHLNEGICAQLRRVQITTRPAPPAT